MASAVQTARELTATARPRTRVGKISDMNTHLIGPIENAKQATKVAAATTFKMPGESGLCNNPPNASNETKHPRLPQNNSDRRPARSINQIAIKVTKASDEAMTTIPDISLVS